METNQLFIIIYIMLLGYAAAGFTSSFYQIVTSKPPAFRLSENRPFVAVWEILLCAVAGPVMILRNAVRARLKEKRPVGWLMATSSLASLWSFCSGVVISELALAIV